MDLTVYALAEDMQGRYPFRGDLHMHSTGSDGRLMKDYVTGDPYAKADLEYAYGRMKRLYQKYFAVE